MEENKHYFSAAAGLIINVNKGTNVIGEGGVTRRVGEKVAEFTPIGDGFGRLVTTDPEVIDLMDKRMGTHGDVFNAAEYNRRTTPIADQLANRETEFKALLESHNRLLSKVGEDKMRQAEAAPKPATK
jgi:hypothetical protein